MEGLLGVLSKSSGMKINNIERGVEVFGTSETSRTVTLSTPVPQGKAFVLHSMHGDSARSDRFFSYAKLQGLNGANEYTELYFERYSTSDPATYSWEVIWSDDVDVQMVEITASGSRTINETITSVDTSKTFVYGAFQSTSSSASDWVRIRLTSSTNLEIHKHHTQSGGIEDGVVYVVESDDFTVTTFTGNFGGTYNSHSIPARQGNEFLILSYSHDEWGSNSNHSAVRASFFNSTTILVDRNSTDHDIYYHVQMVQIKGSELREIDESESNAGSTGDQTIDHSITSVDLNKTIMIPVSVLGNAKTPHEYASGYLTHELLNSTTIRTRRRVDETTTNSSVDFVVFAVQIG